ncbi:MAG: DNA polymerase/3'-5' exonuclease PolX [Candidatus Colwellbacteria bacterium]|nr:DNA polymerase/3'-5' exonuclease PolX [Candidatus Colwellbacteria bacterium]
MNNSEVAAILAEIGEYLSLQDEPFRPRAYRVASVAIEDLDRELDDIYKKGGIKALMEVSGIGRAIAEKIEELLTTNNLRYYEELKRSLPVDLSALSKIEGLGPRKIKTLYEKLGIKTVSDLEKAAASRKISKLAGFGVKSEENIQKSIDFRKSQGSRMGLDIAMSLAAVLVERLSALPGVSRAVIAGSLRRRKETIGDLDLLAVSLNPDRVMKFFTSQREVARVLAKGSTKASVTLKQGIDADLRVVGAGSYGAALAYFTGSKTHNIALRKIAQSKGLKLNEYGLYRGSRRIAGRSEEEIYENLGLQYVEPEMREDRGEIELARRHALPRLVRYGTLKGDLQIQTNWTDGKNSISEMAQAALARKLEYIVITDHTQNLKMVHGLDVKRLTAQGKEIDAVNKKLRGKIKILRGAECDILKDGSMDLPDRALAELDVVGASIHSYFNLNNQQQTERVKRALANPHVDILFHPTGRLIGRRPPLELDMEEIIRSAHKTKTILEVNAFPNRLDLGDEYIRQCVKGGVKMSISSDAHSGKHLDFLDFGVAQARRGWARREDIINAWPMKKMLSSLKKA